MTTIDRSETSNERCHLKPLHVKLMLPSSVDQIRANGGQADAIAADLAAPDGAYVLAAEVRNFADGKLDVLVSNAGRLWT